MHCQAQNPHKTTISHPSRAGYGSCYTHSGNLLNSMSKYYQKFWCDASRHWTTHLQTNSSTSHGLALLLKVLHELENQKVYTEVLPSNIGYTRCHSSLALQLDRDKVKKRLEHFLPQPPHLSLYQYFSHPTKTISHPGDPGWWLSGMALIILVTIWFIEVGLGTKTIRFISRLFGW